MAETKIVVLTQQDEDWEDSGGDHHCYILSCDKPTFEKLKEWDAQCNPPHDGNPFSDAPTIPYDEFNKLIEDAETIDADKCPMMVHGVFNIWTSYG